MYWQRFEAQYLEQQRLEAEVAEEAAAEEAAGAQLATAQVATTQVATAEVAEAPPGSHAEDAPHISASHFCLPVLVLTAGCSYLNRCPSGIRPIRRSTSTECLASRHARHAMT